MKFQKQIAQNKLREARQSAGLTQKQVAKSLKMNIIDRISKWEKGHAIPSIINLFRLSQLLKVSPQDLYPDLFEKMKS